MSQFEPIEDAGLVGRGGAGFPAVLKAKLARQNDAELIVNACDGELGAHKDEYVVAHHLPELMRAAEGISSQITIAAHRDSRTAALVSRAGLPLLEVPDRYVSSEERSLVSLLHGGFARPLPRTRRPVHGAVDARGNRLRPTVVFNAETLWRIDQIAERGVAWFRSYGTPEAPGPRLVTLGDGVRRPGVYEAAAGMRIRDVLDLGGGATGRSAAVAISGLSGGFLAAGLVDDGIRWDAGDLAPYELRLGSGVFDTVPSGPQAWEHVRRVVAYAAGESAGQCGPCMFGLPAVAADLDLLVDGRGDDRVLERLERRLGLLPGRGACAHPDAVSGYVRSALRVFGHHLPVRTRHLEKVPA
ncbi:NADH-ubiquinone oxidoreductase-F iron-sulfur binding region domain-containing protein [Calidifontibacter indicus]|uniref:NADH:ubiquinone oxidoreductase subunit F (NADH-binding) n=1 Tax=Calidifontibacter indicus TaxID=419650 RepID=A0A3D9UTD6_9MICO|nr:NADH-ubiquinone oxidoreductase-F iron-sulfur binding region domain-containing protein [Calidifontibacter indicus]REF29915.1 NADH:ubiquinone oxidoreductase subunit F (NADH-binding) [Calidifontibacter indicus]